MGEREKVLVVDDDPEILDLMAEVIPTLGCEVLLARDGEEALQRFQAEHPPVVITDLAMPKMDGLTLMRSIKEASPRTEVLTMTGDFDVQSGIKAIRQGAFDYLLKPLDVELLVHRVKKALEHYQLTSERQALREMLVKAARLQRTDEGNLPR